MEFADLWMDGFFFGGGPGSPGSNMSPQFLTTRGAVEIPRSFLLSDCNRYRPKAVQWNTSRISLGVRGNALQVSVVRTVAGIVNNYDITIKKGLSTMRMKGSHGAG